MNAVQNKPVTPGVTARLRALLQPRLQPDELVLGSVRPVARHAWTAVGVRSTRSRALRALQMLLVVGLSAALGALGLLLATLAALLAYSATAADWPDTLLLGLVATLALVTGYLGSTWPLRAIRRARHRHYVLTSHAALVVHTGRVDPVVQRLDLTTLQPVRACRVRADGVGDIPLLPHTGAPRTLRGTFQRTLLAAPNARQLATQIEVTRRVRCQRAEQEVIVAMQSDYQGYLRVAGRL